MPESLGQLAIRNAGRFVCGSGDGSRVREIGRQLESDPNSYGLPALPACSALTLVPAAFAGVASSQFTIALKIMLNSP